MKHIKLVYFAWVRDRVGKSTEELELPENVGTIAALMDWLKNQDQGYADAFKDDDLIRVAVNHVHVPRSTSLNEAREIAFFPPMTGG